MLAEVDVAEATATLEKESHKDLQTETYSPSQIDNDIGAINKR